MLAKYIPKPSSSFILLFSQKNASNLLRNKSRIQDKSPMEKPTMCR